MAERLAYLEAVVGADITDFRRSMRDVRNEVGILSSTIGGISGAARTMTFAFTAPMVALGTYAVQAASGFEAAMRNINSIVGLGENDFASLSSKVLDFAKTTRAGVIPATEALYEVFSAGITDQARAIAVWETSNQVAEAGVANLSATTNAITATMSAFNIETADAAHVGNVWTRMVQLGVGSLDDFLSNAQKVLPLSAAMNISLEDMGATLAFLSQGGGGAAKAETSYAMMLSNLLKPTKAMEEALQGLGVASGTDLIKKFGSVGDAIMALREETGAVDFTKLFSKTGLEAALRITTNFEDLTKATADFNKGLDTATMDAWTQQSKSFAFQWDLMLTALQGVATVIGQAIIPLITPLVTGFATFLTKVSETNPQLLQLGVIFVGVVAAAAPLIWLLTSMLNPIGLVMGGVAALAVAFGTNFGGISDTLTAMVPDILGDLQPLKDGIDLFMRTLFPTQEGFDSATGATPVTVDMTDHITVTEPKSLWQIYTEQGYDKKFSWDAFMEEAKAGGWKGGAINIGDEITISGGDTLGEGMGNDFKNGFQNALNSGSNSAMNGMSGNSLVGGGDATTSLFDRLFAAIDTAWPKIQPALSTIFNNVWTWVTTDGVKLLDDAGSSILNSIASWFGTSRKSNFSGNTQSYQMVNGMLQSIPGAVNSLADSFPELTAALTNLFSSIGNWIAAEGLPTIARAAGNLVGNLAVGIGKLLGGVWDAIRPGGGAQTGAKGAADAIGTSVVDPFRAGFADAMKNNDISSGLDSFVSGIAGLIVVAFGVNQLGAMLIGKNLLGALWGSITFAMNGGGAAAATATPAAMTAATGIMTSIKSALLAVALNPITVGIVLGLYIGNQPEVQSFVRSVFDGIFGADSAATFARNTENMVYNTLGHIAEATGNADAAAAYYAMAQPVPGQAPQTAGTQDQQELAQHFAQPLMDQRKNTANNLNPADALATSAGGTGFANMLTTGFSSFLASNASTMAEAIPEADAQAYAQAIADAMLGNSKSLDFTAASDSFTTGVNTSITASAQAKSSDFEKTGQDMVAPIAMGVGQKFKTLPADVDVAGTATGLTQPFVQTFTANFAPGGAVMAPWTMFATQYQSDLQALLATTLATMPGIAAAINGTMASVLIVVDKVNQAITSMGNALNGLNGKSIQFSITSSSSGAAGENSKTVKTSADVAVDGTAKAGMDYVPFDDYIAKLHKGEMVLDRGAAANYRSGVALPPASQGGNHDNSSTTMNFYETTDFDRFLAEAKRRGYRIDKLR